MLQQAMIFFSKDKRGACFALKIKLKLSNVTDKNFYINFHSILSEAPITARQKGACFALKI